MYLYLFEDGTPYSSNEYPTPEDFGAISEGILTILRYNTDISQFEECDLLGNWQAVPECECTTYHAPTTKVEL